MNQIEEYRPVAHEYFADKDFSISNLGNLRNNKTGTIRATCQKGRVQFDRSNFFSVGRLVALTFLAEPDVDYTNRRVKHLDKNPKNNRVENLQWI